MSGTKCGTKAQWKMFQGRPKCFVLATFQKSHLRGDLKIRCHAEKISIGYLAHNMLGKNLDKKSMLDFQGTPTSGVYQSPTCFDIWSCDFFRRNFSTRRLMPSKSLGDLRPKNILTRKPHEQIFRVDPWKK